MAKPNTLFKDAYNRALDAIAASGTLASEARLGAELGISRTTVRTVLRGLAEAGIIRWDRREKRVLRRPEAADYFPQNETDPLSSVIERSFMRRILSGDARPGAPIGEADIAREVGVGVSAVREFLIRFSRFGLIEKRRNSQWVLKGFTRDFALELTEIREMFEIRSARGFASLGESHPIWTALDRLEEEHRRLADEIESRFADFSELDERFHRLIHEASRNRFVTDFYDVIAMVFHYHYQWNKLGAMERARAAIAEHLAYIAALRSRKPMEIDFWCRRHLASARETLLASIPGDADASTSPAQDIIPTDDLP
jgi:DNA-binding GntR family transcriptional regulator